MRNKQTIYQNPKLTESMRFTLAHNDHDIKVAKRKPKHTSKHSNKRNKTKAKVLGMLLNKT